MTSRFLTITLQPDWQRALRSVGRAASSGKYQGEWLNFESPADFFGRLSKKRWDVVSAIQGRGELPVREVARLVGRDVKRVHEDLGVLVELGLVERTDSGGVVCPFASMHIDMHLKAA